MKKLSGLTLIELMICLTMSTLILSGCISVYLGIDQNNQTQLAINTIEENSLAATIILQDAIHKSGYIGCAKLSDPFPLTNKSDIEFTRKNRIEIEANELTIRNASLNAATLVRGMRSDTNLYASDDIKFAVEDVLLISNCQSADIFVVKEVEIQADGIQKIISVNPLAHRYEKNVELRKLEVNTYYIADTGRKSIKREPVFALYVKNINHYKQELVEGIQRMHIENDKSGVSIELLVNSLNSFLLEKKWFIYVATS